MSYLQNKAMVALVKSLQIERERAQEEKQRGGDVMPNRCIYEGHPSPLKELYQTKKRAMMGTQELWQLELQALEAPVWPTVADAEQG